MWPCQRSMMSAEQLMSRHVAESETARCTLQHARNSHSDLDGLPVAPATLLDASTGASHSGRYLGAGLRSQHATLGWFAGPDSARRTSAKPGSLRARSPTLHGGLAIVDAGLLATAFAYVFDRDNESFGKTRLRCRWALRRLQGTTRRPWELSRGCAVSHHPHVDGLQAEFSSRAGRAPPSSLNSRAGSPAPACPPSLLLPAVRPFNFTYKDCDLVHEGCFAAWGPTARACGPGHARLHPRAIRHVAPPGIGLRAMAARADHALASIWWRTSTPDWKTLSGSTVASSRSLRPSSRTTRKRSKALAVSTDDGVIEASSNPKVSAPTPSEPCS